MKSECNCFGGISGRVSEELLDFIKIKKRRIWEGGLLRSLLNVRITPTKKYGFFRSLLLMDNLPRFGDFGLFLPFRKRTRYDALGNNCYFKNVSTNSGGRAMMAFFPLIIIGRSMSMGYSIRMSIHFSRGKSFPLKFSK